MAGLPELKDDVIMGNAAAEGGEASGVATPAVEGTPIVGGAGGKGKVDGAPGAGGAQGGKGGKKKGKGKK